jgi:serine/threonine protein kinase
MKKITRFDYKSISREVDNLKRLKSVFVIQYFDWFFEDGGEVVYIITELCPVTPNIYSDTFPSYKRFNLFKIIFLKKKGDLNGVIEKHKKDNTEIPIGKVKVWSLEILAGLDFLESQKVIHFDVKPMNILLDELGRIKLGDLGLARILDTLSNNPGGTLFYTSPEILDNKLGDFKSDIWSFGCVLYEMLTLERLFKSVSDISHKKIETPKNVDADLTFVLEK